VERNFVFQSSSLDGYENLAADEWFLDHVGSKDLILYFYQNENAVIIGKNQNPWLECDLSRMETDGVQLVRRVSGGGAVYHDAENLNFSFIAGEDRYDLDRQLSLILHAVESFGISCRFSGRNDLEAGGKKFSGNAFADRRGKKLHHGTLLVNSDLTQLQNYLTVSPQKILSKGIDSVRSRVCNLSSFYPGLTVSEVRKAIIKQFETECGYYSEWLFSERERKELAEYQKKHRSQLWRLGQTPKFDLEWNERFPWGGIQLLISFEKGNIAAIHAYSDAMNTRICEEIEKLLVGIPFTERSIQNALSFSQMPEVKELSNAFSLS